MKPYLVYRDGATRTNEVAYMDDVALQSLPPGVVAVEAAELEVHRASDYQLKDGAAVLAPVARPLPMNPDIFVQHVADNSANAGILLVAMRLARFAGDPDKLKAKFQDHASLPAAQKALLIAAATAAGMTLE